MTPAIRPSVLVIGAGSAGLTALKTLRDRGIEATAIDAAGQIGGRWSNTDPALGPVAYRTLHSGTSRDALAYADLPAPRHLPVFRTPDRWRSTASTTSSASSSVTTSC